MQTRDASVAAALLVETCNLDSINRVTYLIDLVTLPVNGWPQARIDRPRPGTGERRRHPPKDPRRTKVTDRRLQPKHSKLDTFAASLRRGALGCSRAYAALCAARVC